MEAQLVSLGSWTSPSKYLTKDQKAIPRYTPQRKALSQDSRNGVDKTGLETLGNWTTLWASQAGGTQAQSTWERRGMPGDGDWESSARGCCSKLFVWMKSSKKKEKGLKLESWEGCHSSQQKSRHFYLDGTFNNILVREGVNGVHWVYQQGTWHELLQWGIGWLK